MATPLELPTGTFVTEVILGSDSPQQGRITNAYSGIVQHRTRAPTNWNGTLSVITKQGHERDFAIFMQAMNGRAGKFRFDFMPHTSWRPLSHPNDFANLRNYNVDAVSGDTLTISPLAGSGSVDWTPATNDFININQRLVRVVEAVSATSIRVAPDVAHVGELVEVGVPYVVAILGSQSQFTMGIGAAGNIVQSVVWQEFVGI